MTILVRVENEILGNDDFWEGNSDNISEILNIVARELAKCVCVDGRTRKDGMWVVSEVRPKSEKTAK